MRNIAFIGVGNMANAIIGGLLRSEAADCPHLILSDKFPEKCAPYTEKGATLTASPAEAAKAADCVVLAVKPQNFPEVLAELAEVCGIQGKTNEEKALKFIEWIEQLKRAMDLPIGVDCIKTQDIPQIIAWAKAEANPLYPPPVVWGDEDFKRLLRTISA